jgi:hypothetical protein
MPTNALYSVGSGGQVVAVCPLQDPRFVTIGRRRFGRPFVPEVELANSMFVPNGRWPAAGWVIVKRGDYNKINQYSTSIALNMTDVQTGASVTLQSLIIVQARCVTRGIMADPNALYLVEIADRQKIVYNPWFQFPINKQYNVRSPAYDGSFYAASSNPANVVAGIAQPWTWDQMVGDVWNQMATFLGPYPHLPAFLADTPENWSFPGVGAWEALNLILEALGLTIGADLTQTNPYTIVVPGAADAGFAKLQTANAGIVEEDFEWIDLGAGRVPAQVVVFFHTRYQFFGTEETIRKDSLQWQSNSVYSVTVAAPAQFSGASGTGFLWADFVARRDTDGNLLAADVATAATVASQITSDFYNRIYRGTLGFLYRRYTGPLPFASGSQVDSVHWKQTDDGGWTTTITRGYIPEPVRFRDDIIDVTGPTT